MTEDDLPMDESDLPPRLTPKQERFCLEYVKDFNAKQAAIRAGYAAGSAEQQGSRLLRFVKVQARLRVAIDELTKGVKDEAEQILDELRKIAFFDIGKAYSKTGMLLPVHEMPEEVRRAIVGLETFEEFEGRGEDRSKVGDTKRLKILDKLRALELLAKRHRLFVDRVEHPVDGGALTLEQIIADSWREPGAAGAGGGQGKTGGGKDG